MNYEDIKTKIEEAETYQKANFQKRIQKYINWYEGRYTNESQKEIPYNVNLTYQLARTMRVSIYSENPSFQVKFGQSIEDSNLRRQSQRIVEEGLKTILNNMSIHRTNRRIIDDAVVCGLGVTKMGYNFGKNSKELVSASNATNKVSDLFTNRINPLNVILPPEATNPGNAQWLCEVIYLESTMAEDFFGKENLPTANKEDDNDQVDYVKIYEFHDFYNQKIITIIDGVNKVYSEEEYPLINEDGNVIKLYQLLWFNDNISDLVYPKSDISYVESQLIEANFNIERRVNFVRKSRSGLFISGQWDEEDLTNLKEGDDAYIVKSLSGDGKVTNVPLMSLGGEFYQNIELIRQEIFETLGITDYMVGSGGGRKATEAQLIERSRMDRVGDRVRIIEDFFYTQVETLIALMKEYEEIGLEVQELYANENISGVLDSEFLNLTDAQVTIIPGSTIELDGSAELAKMEKIVQMAAALDPIVAQQIFKRILEREGFGDLVQDVSPDGQPVNIPGMQGTAGVPSQTPMEQGNLPNLGSAENI